MLRAVSAALVTMAVVIGGADGAGAAKTGSSDTQDLGSTTVDPKTGVATWSATVECTPGDDVEIDVTITQRGDVAFTEAFSECPAAGSMPIVLQTSLQDGSDPLRPGSAGLSIDRTDYLGSSGYQDTVRSATSGEVVIRPGSS